MGRLQGMAASESIEIEFVGGPHCGLVASIPRDGALKMLVFECGFRIRIGDQQEDDVSCIITGHGPRYRIDRSGTPEKWTAFWSEFRRKKPART